MQPVQRRQHPDRHRRWLPLAGAALLLCAAVLLLVRLRREVPAPPEPEESTYGELAAYAAEEVASITVTDRSGETWTALASGGALTLADDPAFAVSARKAEELLDAAAVVAYQRVLTEDPADYREHLADFGLETPWRVDIAYTDGRALSLRIGDRNDYEEPFVYLLAEGDDRLFALDVTSAEILCQERALLHEVTQPVIHKARIDRITFLDGEGAVSAQWALQTEITAGDAEDHWLLTSPVRYPADGERLDALRSNLANLRLGAYIGEATAENLRRCGLDQPRFTLVLHQAAGDISAAEADGALTAVHHAESTLRLSVGSARSEVTDYVAVDGAVYLTSHFSLAALMEMNPYDTLTRYTVPVPLGNLAALTVTRDGKTHTWRLTRTERVLPNNDLATDAAGRTLMDVTVARDGEETPWSAFEAAYQSLLAVTVSGRLPEGWAPEEGAEPTAVYTFLSVTGDRHTVSLLPFDALHDAVAIDGGCVFYLIRGGMSFEP